MKYSLFSIALALVCIQTDASNLTTPNTFSPNTPASAAQVNENFTAVEVAVDDNDSRLVALEAALGSLQSTVNAQQNEINQLSSDLLSAQTQVNSLGSVVIDLQNDLQTLQANSVLDLDGYLQLATINGYVSAEFTGVNLVINNDTGITDGVSNGLGNLVIGYNENNGAGRSFCSNPLYDNNITCTDNGGIWQNNTTTGSHNLVLGTEQSYTSYAAIVAGSSNVSNAPYANVLGGLSQLANGLYSSISAGFNNHAKGTYSSVSDGNNNNASGAFSPVM